MVLTTNGAVWISRFTEFLLRRPGVGLQHGAGGEGWRWAIF